MEKLSELINIGNVLEKQLEKIGIFTYEDLKKEGSKKAWLNIKKIDSSACINRLYALEGAIRKIKDNELSMKVKQELKEFYNKHKN